tara:strand:+ start:27791 stop:28336 length:546 start_codon:yes stop_codon:yes gene_type:complete
MNKPLKNICDIILKEMSIFQSYHLNARKDEDGRVTIPIEINGNERMFAGITDQENCFFYLRWRDDFIFYDELNEDTRISSCENFIEQRSPLRLVAVFDKDVDLYLKEAEIRQILLRWKIYPESGIKSGRTIVRQSLVDSIAVLKEENKTVKKFNKNLSFLLIDFDLSIQITATCDSKILTL